MDSELYREERLEVWVGKEREASERVNSEWILCVSAVAIQAEKITAQRTVFSFLFLHYDVDFMFISKT